MELPPELAAACQGLVDHKAKAVGMLKFVPQKECEKSPTRLKPPSARRRRFALPRSQIPWDQCLEHFEKTEDWTKEKALKEISKWQTQGSGAHS